LRGVFIPNGTVFSFLEEERRKDEDEEDEVVFSLKMDDDAGLRNMLFWPCGVVFDCFVE